MIAALDPVAATPATPPISAPAASAGRTKEELLRTVSASRLGTWLQCRLRFYFRYVAGITKPTTPARHVGSVVHAVLQQWNLARWRRAPLDSSKVQAVFEQAWGDNEESDEIAWDDEQPEAEVKAGAFGLVETYLRDTPIPPEEKPEAVAGRPASGGDARKLKFHESASFIVGKVNAKRSVSLLLFTGDRIGSAGNVTIPPNHDIPKTGQVIDCRYLYAFRESGSIYQPVYLGTREDIRAEECTTDQLKYRSEEPVEQAA